MVRGNVSVSNRNNSTGTATVNWTPAKSTPIYGATVLTMLTFGKTATVIVQNSDDNMTGSAQFNATALPASECSDDVPWIFFGARSMRFFRRTALIAATITAANRIAVSGIGGAAVSVDVHGRFVKIPVTTCPQPLVFSLSSEIGSSRLAVPSPSVLIPCPDPPRCWWELKHLSDVGVTNCL